LQVYIDLDALHRNAQFILQKADKPVAAVVKGDAYGHDVSLVVPSLIVAGVRRFIVSNIREAISLWNLGAEWILVLHPSPDDTRIYDTLLVEIKNSIRFAVWDSSILHLLPSGSRVHIALSTGFGLGINGDVDTSMFKDVEVEGIMGHMPFLDDTPDHQALRKDIYTSFLSTVSHLQVKFPNVSEIHICNSASLFYLNDCPDTTMFRVGVALYGYVEKVDIRPLLRPVMYQMANVIAISRVKKGDSVFYGDIADRDMTIAFVRAGYGDGYVGGPYALHLKSRTYIRRVFDLTMNVSAFDITGMSVEVGDTLVLLGHFEKVRADMVAEALSLSTEKVLTKAGLTRRQALPDTIRDLLQS